MRAFMGLSYEYILYCALAILACVALVFAVYNFFRLRQRLKIYENSMNTPVHGLILFDGRGRYIWSNEAASYFFDFMAEVKTRPKTLKQFLDHAYDSAVDASGTLHKAVQKFTEKTRFTGFREIIQNKSAKYCLVEVVDSGRGTTSVVLVDLSHAKNAEEAQESLEDSVYSLTRAVENAPAGVIITDNLRVGNPIVFCNGFFAQALDSDVKSLIGQKIEEVFAKTKGFRRLDLHDVLKTGKAENLFVEQQLTSDDTRHYTLSVNPRTADEDDPVGRMNIFVLTDITELKSLEARTAQSQKLEALGRLAAGVAHDFNNILSIVDGYARLAENSLDENNMAYDYMSKIRSASSRGASLTQKMLMFSRHKVVSREVTDLRALLAEQQSLFLPLMKDNTSLEMEVSDDDNMAVNVEGSADSFVQILMNLVVNARDATPEGGNVVVSVARVEDEALPHDYAGKHSPFGYACISVKDNGTGMSDDVLKKAFDPFFTTKQGEKGTGLGLSIVYGLVQQLEGHITIRSSRGNGTQVLVYVPCTDKEPAREVVGDLEDLENISLKGYTAMVAEDEPELLSMVSETLKGMDMEVVTARDGNEALLKQEDFEGKFDILITDVTMPGLDGIKLAELFKSLRPETRVVFISGYPTQDKVKVNANANAALPDDCAFLVKPVKAELLVKVVYEVLVAGKDMDYTDSSGATYWKTERAS